MTAFSLAHASAARHHDRPLEPCDTASLRWIAQARSGSLVSAVDEAARLCGVNEFENIDLHALRRTDRHPV
jgi:hypothetical protein